MRKKSFSPAFLFMIILFALGILFASQYSQGNKRIATFSVLKCDETQLIDCVNRLDLQFVGIEKIFIDTKTNIFSIRYESSQISIDTVISFFNQSNLIIESSNSVSLMREEKNQKEKKLFQISFSALE